MRHSLRVRDKKKYFILNSAEHKILNAPKYKNINKFSFLQAKINLKYYFFRLINAKMPNFSNTKEINKRKNANSQQNLAVFLAGTDLVNKIMYCSI